MNKTYSYWSPLLGTIGFILLISVYALAPDVPQGAILVALFVGLILSIGLLKIGLIAGIIAIWKRETGFKKYIGILLPVLIIVFAILVPLLMAIGFILNDSR